MNSLSFTMDELVSELQRLDAEHSEDDEKGFVTKELAAALGYTEHKTRDEIRRLIAAGIVEPANVSRINMCGKRFRALGYRLVNKNVKQDA
jgi:hypothetical protein